MTIYTTDCLYKKTNETRSSNRNWLHIKYLDNVYPKHVFTGQFICRANFCSFEKIYLSSYCHSSYALFIDLWDLEEQLIEHGKLYFSYNLYLNTKHLLTLFTGLLKHDVQERKEGKENILENECVRVACGLLYITTKDNNVMSRIVDRIYKHGMEIKTSLLKYF